MRQCVSTEQLVNCSTEIVSCLTLSLVANVMQLFVPNVFGHVGQCHGNHMQCTLSKLGGTTGALSPGQTPPWMFKQGGGVSPEHMYSE